jgi:hypothetical protein
VRPTCCTALSEPQDEVTVLHSPNCMALHAPYSYCCKHPRPSANKCSFTEQSTVGLWMGRVFQVRLRICSAGPMAQLISEMSTALYPWTRKKYSGPAPWNALLSKQLFVVLQYDYSHYSHPSIHCFDPNSRYVTKYTHLK